MPTARTLQDYASFSEPKSGWNEQTMAEMVAQFRQHQKSTGIQDEHVGLLCFDEVKIEGRLLWDHVTDKLLGFIDFSSGTEETASDLLATHVNRVYFEACSVLSLIPVHTP